MVDLRCLVGAAAMILAGCASTLSPSNGDTSIEATDAVDASATDAVGAGDAVDAGDVRDAETDRPDLDAACPPSAPRPGRGAPTGLACSYPNGCTFRCDNIFDASTGYWFTVATCF